MRAPRCDSPAHAEQQPAGDEPLALLLRAQTAQLNGDRAGAEAAFRAMAERADTRLLGLRGLFVEAQRRNDPVAARLFAEQAAKDAPALPWAGPGGARIPLRGGRLGRRARDPGTPAHERRARPRRRGGASAPCCSPRARSRSRTSSATPRARSRSRRRELAPDLVPAAELAGRLLAEAGERRKAGKIIEAAWKANPHPDLAEGYAHVRLSDSARDRLARVQALARMAPGHAEGALAVARAALDAREFAAARAALEPLRAEPTQRVAMLMARAERAGRRRGPRARMDGRARSMRRAIRPGRRTAIVSERWLPVSPVTGRLDAFQWKVPVAELGERAAPVLIEAAARSRLAAAARRTAARGRLAAARQCGAENGRRRPPCRAPRPAPRARADHPAGAGAGRSRPRAASASELDAPPDDGRAWQRIRQLFR